MDGCDAMPKHAHHHQPVIHFDASPLNILLGFEGREGRAMRFRVRDKNANWNNSKCNNFIPYPMEASRRVVVRVQDIIYYSRTRLFTLLNTVLCVWMDVPMSWTLSRYESNGMYGTWISVTRTRRSTYNYCNGFGWSTTELCLVGVWVGGSHFTLACDFDKSLALTLRQAEQFAVVRAKY